MVPAEFTDKEIEDTRKYILKQIKANSRFVNGKVLGNPYVFYKDIANLLGYTIDSESDGDRLGWVVGGASRLEFPTNRLLISAVVVSVDYRRPGAGFYDLAQEMGLFTIKSKKANADGLNELTYWNDHIKKIVEVYGRK